MTTRRNFLASLVAAVAMAPQLLRFKAELPRCDENPGFKEFHEWCEKRDFPYRFPTSLEWYVNNLEPDKFPEGMGNIA